MYLCYLKVYFIIFSAKSVHKVVCKISWYKCRAMIGRQKTYRQILIGWMVSHLCDVDRRGWGAIFRLLSDNFKSFSGRINFLIRKCTWNSSNQVQCPSCQNQCRYILDFSKWYNFCKLLMTIECETFVKWLFLNILHVISHQMLIPVNWYFRPTPKCWHKMSLWIYRVYLTIRRRNCIYLKQLSNIKTRRIN